MQARELLLHRLGPRGVGRIELEHARDQRGMREGINPVGAPGCYLSDVAISRILKGLGLYWRGRRNALDVRLRHHVVASTLVPSAFCGFKILQLSDLHSDLNAGLVERVSALVSDLSYDICVMTGDYRGKSSGPFEAAIDGIARLQAMLRGPVYGVLGDHDTIWMVPALEQLGIKMLLNESVMIARDNEAMYLAGIDDAHGLRAADIPAASCGIPEGVFSVLLSHTPEIYRQAAEAKFNMLLSGHTHGGQICLPGGVPVTLEAVLPRRMGSGSWTFAGMIGYTSVGAGSSIVPVRFNCPPEITLHHFHPTTCA